MEEKEIRKWAAFCHLSAITGMITPLANLVLPLILWLLKRDESPFINAHGKEALNFQLILMLVYLPLITVLAIMIIFMRINSFDIVELYLHSILFLAIYGVIMSIYGAIRAKQGHMFRYPFIFRILK